MVLKNINFSWLVFLLVFFTSINLAFGQEETDSTSTGIQEKMLDEVTVIGYEANRNILEVPGSIDQISTERINSYDENSLVPAMNTVPGVRMERRAPGSYRIAIRGSLLRAPFGVRNIKIYWNGFPITEPSGSTLINLFDVANMQRVEVTKGPAGSMYGAGTGGVINLHSYRKGKQPNGVSLGTNMGSFGMKRYSARLNHSGEKAGVQFNYAHQESNGYRDHSEFNRDVAHLRGVFNPSENREISVNLFYSDLFYEIPGGLNKEQFERDPTLSRPGSIEQNASINIESFKTSISHDYQWNENLGNKTTIYTSQSFFDHPFNTDYKREGRNEAGGRSRFYYDTQIGGLPVKFNLGGEFQTRSVVARNFGNDDGEPTTLNFDDELKSKSGLLFSKAQVDLPNNLFFNAGLSYNRLNYDIYRLRDLRPEAEESSNRIERDFRPVLAPRIGLVKRLPSNISIHGSFSYGFSPPTMEEFRTNEGSIDYDLQPEEGTNYEVGIRGNTLNNKLNFDLTAFSFKLKETIVSRTGRDGTQVFDNTGTTDQKGMELSATYFLINNPDGFVSRLDLSTSYTYHPFVFEDYEEGGEDFSGNNLTGVAPNISVTNLDLETRHGFYLHASYNFTDEIPLNDANTVYSSAYNLVQGKAGYKWDLNEDLQIDFFAGVDNALNEKYSLGNDLNPWGGRYYQPAPARNYYGGIKLHLNY